MAKLQTQKELEALVRKFRKRLSIDLVDAIHIRIVEDKKMTKSERSSGIDAWIESDDTHPIHFISIRHGFLKENRKHPKHIVRTVVHELLHIVVKDVFIRLKPSYSYANPKHGILEELLVTKIAKAIIPVKSEELYERS